jgi:hypothetical protein
VKRLKIADGRLDSIVAALLVAGEVEGVLANGERPLTNKAASITNSLARACVGIAAIHLADLFCTFSARACFAWSHPCLSPQGFAYYALHPVDLVETVIQAMTCESAASIGIRSIGTTLSAVATSALASRIVFASRITVRPLGHPYDRKLEFTQSQADWLEQQRTKNAATKSRVINRAPSMSKNRRRSAAHTSQRMGTVQLRCFCARKGLFLLYPKRFHSKREYHKAPDEA